MDFEPSRALPAHLEVVADNAHRLLADARLLFANRSYATSVAISILAIEEAAKFLLVADGRYSGLGNHAAKQAALSKAYLSGLWGTLSIDLLLQRPELVADVTRETGPIGDALNPAPKATRAGEALREAFEEKIRVSDLAEARFARQAGLGLISKAKEAALYVDVDRNGKIRTNPADVSEKDAEEWLSQANRALAEVEMHLYGYE
jgi:AbiV